MELIGLYFIAAGLLLVAGTAKTLRPDGTARAIGDLVVPPGHPAATTRRRRIRVAVRAGAMLEAVLGVLAIAFPRPLTAALVATSYAVFGGVVVYARSRGGALSSCGCFGRADTPATALHGLLDVALAGVCIAVAAGLPANGSVGAVLGRQPAAGIPLVFVSAVGLYLAYLALSVLPALEGARRLMRPGTSR